MRYLGLLALIAVGPLYLYLQKQTGYGHAAEILTGMTLFVIIQAAILLRD
jgi:hypothetical protein